MIPRRAFLLSAAGALAAQPARIRFEDGSHYQFPNTRWSFSHLDQLLATRPVPRGPGPAIPLPVALRKDLDAVTFRPIGKEGTMTWEQSLEANYTDGIVVLHRGRIVYERYFGETKPDTLHIAFSVTKSFVATLAMSLIVEGVLDESAKASKYVPELRASGFSDATVRQLLDMTTGIAYSETYTDPQSPVWNLSRAAGFLPKPAGYKGPATTHDFLIDVAREGEHGKQFVYKTVNTDALAWVMTAVAGKPLEQVLSERIWQRLGMERDARIIVDSSGVAFGGGGLLCSLRDMARFGEMMRLNGRFAGRQILPEAGSAIVGLNVSVVDQIRQGGDRALFAKAGYHTLPGWSYRAMWWVSHGGHQPFAARGIHGQGIYVDPRAEMVIARFASHPMGGNINIDPTSLPAYQSVAERLMS